MLSSVFCLLMLINVFCLWKFPIIDIVFRFFDLLLKTSFFSSLCKLLKTNNLKKCLKIIVFFLSKKFAVNKKCITFALAFGTEHTVPVLGSAIRSLTSFHTDKQYNPAVYQFWYSCRKRKGTKNEPSIIIWEIIPASTNKNGNLMPLRGAFQI